jgi:hypothetical protein
VQKSVAVHTVQKRAKFDPLGTKPVQSAFVSAVQIVENPQVEEVQKAFQHQNSVSELV